MDEASDHLPGCAAAAELKRPRILQRYGPRCTCAKTRESIRKSQELGKRLAEDPEFQKLVGGLIETTKEDNSMDKPTRNALNRAAGTIDRKHAYRKAKETPRRWDGSAQGGPLMKVLQSYPEGGHGSGDEAIWVCQLECGHEKLYMRRSQSKPPSRAFCGDCLEGKPPKHTVGDLGPGCDPVVTGRPVQVQEATMPVPDPVVKRWERRVKLVEARAQLAREVLEGRRDDLLDHLNV